MPGERRVLDERDLLTPGADEGSNLVVGVGDDVRAIRDQLVAARDRFRLEPLDLRFEHDLWRQARPGVVEMLDTGTTRGVAARTVQVDRHAAIMAWNVTG